MYRSVECKLRCKEVDEEIEFLFKQKIPIHKIARAIPIGEAIVLKVLREKKLMPREFKREKFATRQAKDKAYYENVRKPKRLADKLKKLEEAKGSILPER